MALRARCCDTCLGVEIGTLFAQLFKSRRAERCVLERMFHFVELPQRERVHRSRQMMLLCIQVEVLPTEQSTDFRLDLSRLIQPVEYGAHKSVQHLVQCLEERPEKLPHNGDATQTLAACLSEDWRGFLLSEECVRRQRRRLR